MKHLSGIILFLILLYPFFYAIPYVAFQINYSFVLYYFAPLTLIFLALNAGKKPLEKIRKHSINLCLLVGAMVMVIINTNDARYSKPLFFFIYILSLYLLSITVDFKENKKLIQQFFIIFLVLSFCFLISKERYLDGDRYFAFLLSPTVYSVYAEVFLILYLNHTSKASNKIIMFVVIGAFMIITKTRLNLFFYISIPVLLYYLARPKFPKLRVFIIYIFCLNMLYPIYSYLVTFDFGKKSLVSTRYENGNDSSFGLRNYLNSIIYDEYIHKTTVAEKLFGSGTEEARKIIIKRLKYDLFAHNDFIRFAYDFGLIALILFLIFIYRVSVKNPISFIILLLYLFSFYHNMIYDFFLISIVLFYSNIKKQEQIEISPLIIPDTNHG